jgi:hypothetical protein
MDEKYLETLERIEKVRRAVEEWLSKSSPTLSDTPVWEAGAAEHMDRAMEHCEKAEKLLAEGRVKEAMREEALCVSEMGDAANAKP